MTRKRYKKLLQAGVSRLIVSTKESNICYLMKMFAYNRFDFKKPIECFGSYQKAYDELHRLLPDEFQ